MAHEFLGLFVDFLLQRTAQNTANLLQKIRFGISIPMRMRTTTNNNENNSIMHTHCHISHMAKKNHR